MVAIASDCEMDRAEEYKMRFTLSRSEHSADLSNAEWIDQVASVVRYIVSGIMEKYIDHGFHLSDPELEYSQNMADGFACGVEIQTYFSGQDAAAARHAVKQELNLLIPLLLKEVPIAGK